MAATAVARTTDYQERTTLLRPRRLGTQRRALKPAPIQDSGALGDSRAAARRAASLDTEKHLATTVAEWLRESETATDKRTQKYRLQAVLLGSLQHIFQDNCCVHCGGELMLDRPAPKTPDTPTEKLKAKIKGPRRVCSLVLRCRDCGEHSYYDPSFQRQWEQVYNCQREWIGYKATCCDTKAVAVPIGCNHRLCPLCNSQRSARYRNRLKTMFDRLEKPYLLTLTIPNIPFDELRKHEFTLFREKARKFLKNYSVIGPNGRRSKGHKCEWIKGGVYSLETTYNRAEKSWHIHVHVLCDVTEGWPGKDVKEIAPDGREVPSFTLRKMRMEFEWLRLWGAKWKSHEFPIWYEATRRNRVNRWSPQAGRYVPDNTLHPEELQKRREWNRHNRRLVNVKPVTDRDGAAREVLKYITKVSEFSDLPAAVHKFMRAVKGARMIQTFGSWYGVDLSVSTDTTDTQPDWSELKCNCGQNHWKKLGSFFRHEVAMQPDGRFTVIETFDSFAREGPYRQNLYPKPERTTENEHEYAERIEPSSAVCSGWDFNAAADARSLYD